MPIYEFRCRECGREFEAIRPVGDTGASLECPSCGARGPDKQPSVFAPSSGKGAVAAGGSGASCGSGFR